LSGISFHVGSGCKDPQQFREATEQAYNCLKDIRAEGHAATTIDIGGGFMSGPLFNQTAAAIQPLLHNICSINPEVRFIAEPGRFFAASSHDLFVRVIGKKSAGRGKAGWRYTLDESLYGQFSCIPFDYAKPQWIRVRAPGEARRRSTPAILYGRTCDSLDFIAAAEEAEELEEGDWLWFPHMGAYTTATSTEFNGFPKPPSLVLEDEHMSLPEPEDFLANDWPYGVKYVGAVQVPA
jgi:ornithine decarboxylase